ncbi:KTSC domain-containing protein [Mycobacteroides abscessus]|uniref:KTSC domain-containing protein n=1 Tax=Mycobacteroides abscessus TaxID=36809 RepID=UPI00092A06EE|nr:KTSC domain-containing protein [Mycobacteroides abscessus]SHQ49486.1 Uncharacterised protein [Mycobacteroides abscessus subsp. abscessus]SKQ84374.1 Uncharacterised protein [Mycobacteroides abscessus subsp. massiliense]SLC49438.1 Uncharacterised protein [Mycobacteroides abscessus subsp. massiliense]
MSKIKRHAVATIGIVSIGYDREFSVLEVEFNGGHLLTYTGVPEAVYVGLCNAERVTGLEHLDKGPPPAN